MIRSFPLLMLLSSFGLAAAAAPVGQNPTLQLRAYPQRLSERFTQKDGLPSARVLGVDARGAAVRVQTETGWSAFRDGKWLAAPADPGYAPYPVVPVDKLPTGARVRSAAKTARGQIWAVTNQGLFRSVGEAMVRVPFPRAYLTHQRVANTDAQFSCVMADSNSTIWLGSDTGVFATDGADWWNTIDRTDGLPYEYVTCLALGRNGDLWVGTTEGVCRYNSEGAWQYYWGPRWLPNNRVNDIGAASDGSAWVATDGGVAHLYDRPLTLAQKAKHYEDLTVSRHNRRGFITDIRFKTAGNPAGGHVFQASDNDGLWTAVYVAAESFRWAATRDPAARAEARKSMMAMLDLVRYSGVPGFPARCIIRRGEEVDGYNPDETVRVEGEPDKIWFTSPVDPQILCKGDTSSDEMDGHYFAWYVFYELVATDADRRSVREAVRACTDNILSHDLTLVGPTGRKTRWGVWHPRFINDDPAWWEERGLNSLEILAFLKVAHHITGDAKYQAEYRRLIEQHHYLLNTVTQKVAEPWHQVNHSDDQMAFMVYYCLLNLEKDPATRLVLLQSMDRSWKAERPEESPFFNFVYGATTGGPCDVEASVAALQDWPWELIEWQSRGSHRHDVRVLSWNGEGSGRSQVDRALPPGERRMMRWNGNPYAPDGGSPTGASEDDGAAWLLPYWLARHHRLISDS